MTYYSYLLSVLCTIFLSITLIGCQNQQANTSGDQDVNEDNSAQTQTISEQPDPDKLTEKEIEALIKQHVKEKDPKTGERRAYWSGCDQGSELIGVAVTSGTKQWKDGELSFQGQIAILCKGYSKFPDEQMIDYIVDKNSGELKIRAEPPVQEQIYR